ncbi:MAG: hypothetical protein COA79_23925 [Planctomycetota bacterium]|nr:MAG: hypothetical protein COA79_23925 [Planctomycetota bacterium]
MTYFKPTHATKRFPGIRWKIRYGNYQGIQTFAINEAQKALQAFTSYTIDINKAIADQSIEEIADGDNLLIIGTPKENPLINMLLEKTNTILPEHKEAYYLNSQPAPWNSKQSIIMIAATTATGVLYGVEDFNTRILGADILVDDPLQIKLPDIFPSFTYSETPKITHRGIWTWGYAIYDYKCFLDNMARLRMNMLTIWNDCPPINMPQVIDYAHNRGIKIVLGFPWGWGMDLDLTNKDDQQKLKQYVINTYEKEYSNLQHDGVYFQTLTETNKKLINSQPRAKVVCELVNDISKTLLEHNPSLDIQFGLHATSIMEDFHHLESLDKRVSITWEDAGVIPYAYDVLTTKGSPENNTGLNHLNTVEATINYSKKIASLRNGCNFSMVAKGFAKIRWGSEFEHHQSFILGERSESFMKLRKDKEQASWQKKNGLWFANYEKASRFYQEILSINPDNMNVTALIEDGLFERKIEPCVALFANILWNPNIEKNDLMIYTNSAYLNGCI